MGRAGPVGFDLDLTLIDSRSAILAAWVAVAAETGVHIGLDDVDARLGIKLEDEVAYWFPAAEQVSAAACYRRHYLKLAASLTTLLPGAVGGACRGPRGRRARGDRHRQARDLGGAKPGGGGPLPG